MGHRGPVLGTGDRTIPRAQRPAAWVWVMGGLGGNEEQPSKQSLGGLGGRGSRLHVFRMYFPLL